MGTSFNKTFWGTCVLIFAFWLINVRAITATSVIIGIVSSLAIVYFFDEHLLTIQSRFPIVFKNIVRLIKYIANLISEIIVANIQVAKIVLSPEMNLSPTFIKFSGKLKKDASKAILGNSITLTPGTLTIDIEGNDFIVHGLTKSHAEGVLDWYMEDQLVKMEEEE
ncbi:Na+/H+ antiporter subunit E [Natranaerobius trueperi]|uniref:Na+/H+ antiporter subunit E n=1 Tax=Natranaerobius trueperi TaxID=759412 RepID=A0A226BY13_9FIRM|nr:Na+/H+ antiporter subunit E [Natranaerobius trueperi]OWZ83903.1 hypothetical protein CDO51_05820 [Natranaerobius trueperi]